MLVMVSLALAAWEDVYRMSLIEWLFLSKLQLRQEAVVKGEQRAIKLARHLKDKILQIKLVSNFNPKMYSLFSVITSEKGALDASERLDKKIFSVLFSNSMLSYANYILAGTSYGTK